MKSPKKPTTKKLVKCQNRKECVTQNRLYIPTWWFDANGIGIDGEYFVVYETDKITATRKEP